MKTTFSVMAVLTPLSLAAVSTPPYLPFSASTYGNETATPDNGYSTFLAAAKNPNATHTVSFDYNDRANSGKDWTWTLGISDVPMANLSNTTKDAHVAYITYDFAWPGGSGNLNDAVVRTLSDPTSSSERSDASCLYFIYATLPQNVSDAWDSSSSDCTSALGADCVSRILSSMILRDPHDCGSGRITIPIGEPCASSFALASGIVTDVVPFGNASVPEASSLHSGDTYAWALSNTYPPGDQEFQAEENKLRVIGLRNSHQTQLLCNRVGPGSGNNTNTENPSHTSPAPSTTPSTGAGSRKDSIGMMFALSMLAMMVGVVA